MFRTLIKGAIEKVGKKSIVYIYIYILLDENIIIYQFVYILIIYSTIK
jgi:hypothetical protein